MDKKWTGIILLVAGTLILIGNLGWISGNLSLTGVGLVFLIFYGMSGKTRSERSLGLLIPGLIVSAIGVHSLLTSNVASLNEMEFLFFILLGTAFLGIYFIHTRKESGGKWPLYPTAGLYAFSAFLMVVDHIDSHVVEFIAGNLFPLVVIVIGLFMVVKSYFGKD